MSDLVERLRRQAKLHYSIHGHEHAALITEAAAEIERLEKENKELRELLEDTLPHCHGFVERDGERWPCGRIATWQEWAVADESSWYCEEHRRNHEHADRDDIWSEDQPINRAAAALRGEVPGGE